MRQAFLLTSLLVAAAAAGVSSQGQKEGDLFRLPLDRCEAIQGCDVKPAEKVVQTRVPTSFFEPARPSCCAYHQGVCGCSANRAVCCDGSYSAGCGCD